jgi:cysteine-rich repeat protein
MFHSRLASTWVLTAGICAFLPGCGDDNKVTAETSTTETGDGDGDSGDGDGDGSDADQGDGDGDGDQGDGDGDQGDGDGDQGDGDGDGDQGDGDGDGDGDAAECGNGVLDPGEQCDDGTDNGDTFACLSDCTLNVCGDGFVGPEEGCDDGNLVPQDGCSENCLLEDVDPQAVPCGNKIYQCGDLLDNDMDGFTDLDDHECISPCDNDEGSFQTELPGQNNDCKGDCYFDDNSGGGDDHCEWNLQCDPENPGAEIGCPYDPNFAMCDLEMPQSCLDFCTPLVPNGCDCFGCCEIDGQFVYLDGADCALDNLDGCTSCTFFDNCNNPCEPELCELCFGQDPEDLPDDCEEPSCPEDATPCEDISDCELGWFCQTGCCIPIDPQ